MEMNKDSKLRTDTLKGIEALRNRLGGWMTVKELDTLFDATLIIKSAFENEQCKYCKHNFDPTDETIDEMVKPTKCPCGELFDAKDSSFCPKCGCAYGELSGRYTNIGR